MNKLHCDFCTHCKVGYNLQYSHKKHKGQVYGTYQHIIFLVADRLSVWPHLFRGANHEKRTGEQFKWSLAFRLYIGSFGAVWPHLFCGAGHEKTPTPNILQAGCTSCRPANNIRAATD